MPSQRDYSIILLDRTTITRHHSDIVSALATKTNLDVTLIDPFQLIDWKDRTPPDHLYPKFKVFMENFKEKYQTNLPEITSQETQETAPTSDNEVGTQAEEQGLQPDLCHPESIGLDTLLKRLMDPNTQPEPLDKPKLLTASKRPRNKGKLKQANALEKPSYNPPLYGERSICN